MNISVSQFAILGVSAFGLTGLLTWPVRVLAIRLGAMDAPNVARKTQPEPVPYLGGIAIAIGIVVTTLVALFVSESSSVNIGIALSTLCPAIVLGIVGLVDDFKSLMPWPRLVIQTLVGFFVSTYLAISGTRSLTFGNDLVDFLVTVVWVVGICNAVNFFDNLDGAASGSVAVISTGLFTISFLQGQEMVAALSLVMAGATLGFLIWNKSPAKIYMGDAGSLFLGVLISVLTIRIDPSSLPQWKSLFLPLVLLAIPLLDTSVAVISRLKRGISPFTGGRDHLSHRLLRSGLSRRVSAIVLWMASGICSLIAIGIYRNPATCATYLIAIFTMCWVIALLLILRSASQG
jgi:UDP-GlcNAc:undecaprenyl-phosphate GlcNAc-1-phosphate transferase